MTIENLLSRGYFPSELPPAFHTSDLATKYKTLKGKLGGQPVKESTRCSNFSIAKVGLVRKLLKIPNPAHQVPLSEIFAENWADIDAVYKLSKISFSRPTTNGSRAANPKKFGEFLKRCFLQSYSYTYELKTDISKFYPSIYTHSIAWALHTKPVAKARRNDKSLLGNKIDFAVQQTMHGQTIGIPIGPDTSLLIAEIIGCQIDNLIRTKIPSIKGFRYIDDMYFFFNTHADAEIALIHLQQIFKEYELQINADKTKIRSLPHGIETEWVTTLRSFVIRDETPKKQYNDIVSYFSLAFDYALKHPTEYVLSYTINRIQHLELLSDDNFSLLESMLLKTIVAEPSTIKEVFRILYTYRKKVRVKKLETVIFDFVCNNCRRGYDYEVAWGLWILKSFKIKMPKENVKILETCSDPVCMLIILDLIEMKLIRKVDINLDRWKTTITKQSLLDENWLLAYECAVKKWLLDDFDYINEVPYFKILHKNKISFYDSGRQIDVLTGIRKKSKAPTKSKIAKSSKTKKKPAIESYTGFIDDYDISLIDDEQDVSDDVYF